MRIEESQTAADVRPLLDQWAKIVNGQDFGLEVTAAATEQDVRRAEVAVGRGARHPRHPGDRESERHGHDDLGG
jgi:hypothetical protein